jgi:hypothetical protein
LLSHPASKRWKTGRSIYFFTLAELITSLPRPSGKADIARARAVPLSAAAAQETGFMVRFEHWNGSGEEGWLQLGSPYWRFIEWRIVRAITRRIEEIFYCEGGSTA